MKINEMVRNAIEAHPFDIPKAVNSVRKQLRDLATQAEKTAATYENELLNDGIKSRIESMRAADKRFVKQTTLTEQIVNRSVGGGSEFKRKVSVTARRSRSADAYAAVNATLFDTWMFHRAGKCLGDMTRTDWDVEIQCDTVEQGGLEKNIQFNITIRDSLGPRNKTKNVWTLDEIEVLRDDIYGGNDDANA